MTLGYLLGCVCGSRAGKDTQYGANLEGKRPLDKTRLKPPLERSDAITDDSYYTQTKPKQKDKCKLPERRRLPERKRVSLKKKLSFRGSFWKTSQDKSTDESDIDSGDTSQLDTELDAQGKSRARKVLNKWIKATKKLSDKTAAVARRSSVARSKVHLQSKKDSIRRKVSQNGFNWKMVSRGSHWPLGNLDEILDSVIDGKGISRKITLRWMSLNLTVDNSTMVQVMAWWRQTTSYYLSQCWYRHMWPFGITKSQWVDGKIHSEVVGNETLLITFRIINLHFTTPTQVLTTNV